MLLSAAQVGLPAYAPKAAIRVIIDWPMVCPAYKKVHFDVKIGAWAESWTSQRPISRQFRTVGLAQTNCPYASHSAERRWPSLRRLTANSTELYAVLGISKGTR